MSNMIYSISGDTEFFNGAKWKKLSECTETDNVLQYNEDGTAELVRPLAYGFERNDNEFYEFKHMGFPAKLTNYRSMVVRDFESNQLKRCSCLAIKETMLVPVSCLYNGYLDLDRKSIARLIEGVESVEGAKYTFDLYTLSLDSKRVFIEYLMNSKFISEKNNFKFTYTSSRENMDLVGFLVSTSGGNFIIDGDSMVVFTENANCSRVGFSDDYVDYLKVSSEEEKYGLVVPSHMLVLRRKGLIFVTGDAYKNVQVLG